MQMQREGSSQTPKRGDRDPCRLCIAEEYVEKLSFDHLKGATIGQSPNAHDYQKNAPKADIPKVLIKVRVKSMFGSKKSDLLFSRDRGSAPQGPGSSLQRG